jgi:hypothetical protein
MRRPSLAYVAAVTAFVGTGLIAERSGVAQIQDMQLGNFASAPARPVSPDGGMQVGEGVYLHAGVGAEGGYDSNVFYNDQQRASAALIRVTPYLNLTNTTRSGQAPSGLLFDARASLTYREYLANEADIKRLRAFMPTFGGMLEHNTGGRLVLGITDSYARMEDAPYSRGTGPAADVIVRDNNVATAQLRWSPGGGRLQGLIRYTNTWDRFDTAALRGASSLGHEGMLDVSWRWLPKTSLYLQVRQGYIYYYNADTTGGLTGMPGTKPSSYPLRVSAGIRGLVTEKTAITLAAGYQNAFYSSGPSTAGFLGSTAFGAELVIMPLAGTRITMGAKHEFTNSVIGNFYYADGGYVGISQQTVMRLIGQLYGRYEYRRYYGVAGMAAGGEPRIDHWTQAGATLDYFIKAWAYAGVSYILSMNRSDFMPAMATLAGVDYTKHQIFARLGITY